MTKLESIPSPALRQDTAVHQRANIHQTPNAQPQQELRAIEKAAETAKAEPKPKPSGTLGVNVDTYA